MTRRRKTRTTYDLTPGATNQFEGFSDDKLPDQRVSFGTIKRKSDKKQWADKHFEWLMKERKKERNRLAQRRFQAKKKSKETEEATNAALEDKTAQLEKEKSDLVERNSHLMAIVNDLQTRNNLLEGENMFLKEQLQTMQQQQQGPAAVINQQHTCANNYYGPVISGGNMNVSYKDGGVVFCGFPWFGAVAGLQNGGFSEEGAVVHFPG